MAHGIHWIFDLFVKVQLIFIIGHEPEESDASYVAEGEDDLYIQLFLWYTINFFYSNYHAHLCWIYTELVKSHPSLPATLESLDGCKEAYHKFIELVRAYM